MSTSGISEPALNALLESRSRFLGFLKKRLPSPDAAEDILQHAFLKGIEKGGGVRDEESIVGWFYRILRNSVVDYYRESDKSPQDLKGALEDLERYAKAAPDSRNEVCMCIHPLLESLKPEYREALTTVDLEDGRLAELATLAGISEGNAAVRLHRAREAMRKRVRMTCGACAEHYCADCHCKHR